MSDEDVRTDAETSERLERLEKLVAEMRAEIVEQEHRGLPILRRFFVDRRKWGREDPRRDAATKALLYRLFFSPGAAALGGSAVALATLVFLVVQVALLREQNEAVVDQNSLIGEQFERQRRTELVRILYERIETGPTKRGNSRVRAEALVEFIELERARLARISRGEESRPSGSRESVSLSGAFLDGIRVDQLDASGVDFSEASLAHTVFSHGNFSDANFVRASLKHTYCSACDFSGAVFAGTDLECAGIWVSRLDGAWSLGLASNTRNTNWNGSSLLLSTSDTQYEKYGANIPELLKHVGRRLRDGFAHSKPMVLSDGLPQPSQEKRTVCRPPNI